MRTFQIISILLGLVLIVLSWLQIEQARKYQILVSQVQSTAGKLYERALKLRPANMSILIWPSMGSVLSELDAAKKLERGWWVASGIGCVVSVVGLAAMILDLLRRKAANKSLHATAAAPGS